MIDSAWRIDFPFQQANLSSIMKSCQSVGQKWCQRLEKQAYSEGKLRDLQEEYRQHPLRDISAFRSSLLRNPDLATFSSAFLKRLGEINRDRLKLAEALSVPPSQLWFHGSELAFK